MIRRAVYMKYRAKTNDPVFICYSLYIHYSNNISMSYKEFTVYFSKWLKQVGNIGLLQGCISICANLDKKYGKPR